MTVFLETFPITGRFASSKPWYWHQAMVGARVDEIFKKEAKERRKAGQVKGGKTAGKSRPKLADSSVENLPPSKGKARDQDGAAVNVSGKSVDFAEKVIKHGTPELQRAVDSGEVAVSTAAKLAGLPKQEQKKALAAGKQGIQKAVAVAKPLKPPIEYPLSTQFVKWLQGVFG